MLIKSIVTKTLICLLMSVLILWGLLAWVIVDTREYRKALKEFSNEKLQSELLYLSKRVDDDFRQYADCKRMHADSVKLDQFDFEPLAHSCLVNGLIQVSSYPGAIAFASLAHTWLAQHPEDVYVKSAALSAIYKGRSDLLDQKYWHMDLHRRVSIAHDKSRFMTFIEGFDGKYDQFLQASNELDLAEFSVTDPNRMRAQRSWKLEVISGPQE